MAEWRSGREKGGRVRDQEGHRKGEERKDEGAKLHVVTQDVIQFQFYQNREMSPRVHYRSDSKGQSPRYH